MEEKIREFEKQGMRVNRKSESDRRVTSITANFVMTEQQDEDVYNFLKKNGTPILLNNNHAISQ